MNAQNELNIIFASKFKIFLSLSEFTADSDDGNKLTNLINKIKGNDGTSVAGVGMSYTGYKG